MAGECFNAVSILQYVANVLNSVLHESRLLNNCHACTTLNTRIMRNVFI